ncbi:hypothetical protein F5B22DRAFT_584483 [Xylaria bambusicola]|uniref:uncharacterized protein n=1 Tax=Xylaria bambusicola TaxID=326684 RepID=UPI002008075D|nr:uncharacterized protein F5B22DRAFT_584483 [Xylaria bambusicola]KAI0528286.1 hypothetical protein F5B22DRAFT_584483 [Xylaria bambusicola]
MLAASETVARPATTTSLYFDLPYEHQPLPRPSQRSFKKHKVLPRPRANTSGPFVASGSPSTSRDHSNCSAAALNLRESGSPRATQDYFDPRGIGPNLPPTPPAHSRTSSGSQPTLISTPPPAENPAPNQVAVGSVTPIPGTPTLQRSPPTPDVTPPQVGRRPKAFRPNLSDRLPSKATVDSRTESFKTARESPTSSDEEKTTPRPCMPSTRTWQNAEGRRVEPKPRNQRDAGLGLRLDVDDDLIPRTRQEFFAFDGEWASNSDVEQEWDDNLSRNVTVRKRRVNPREDRRTEVIEDVMVTPTNATRALRSVSLHERVQTAPSPQYFPSEFSSKSRSRWTTSTSGSSSSTDFRRSSGMSSKSTVSTVVEAILVDVPTRQQKTLRHVRKQTALRDSTSEFSPPSSTSTSVRQMESSRRPRILGKAPVPRTDSMASTGTVNSVASRKVRREVWQSGGIPVVVIPDRKDSLKSKASRPPSLRSTNSKRSHSVPRSNFSGARDQPVSSDNSRRRGRSMSVTYGSFPNDQLTMDYPPIVPRRTTSLSAPTSRNTSRAGSRAGSLTAESLKAHNALIDQEGIQLPQFTVEPAPHTENTSSRSDQKQLYPAPSVESHKNETLNQKSLVDHNGDPFFGKRLTAYNTPFSQASVETNGTHSVADIVEALAVNIYPHQNKSVLMVHHMSKSLSSANDKQAETSPVSEPEAGKITGKPEITTTGPSDGPVTPPQPQLSMDGVDSPLRNPRAPPEPPAIKFIPATPSGLTPATEQEKMLGNYFEETQKRPSLVRRALSLRKPSDNPTPRRPSLLSRTLSLSKTTRTETAESPGLEKTQKPIVRQYPTADDPPPDESKLHPFWRPADDYYDDANDFVYDVPEGSHADAHYSSFDNGRSPLRRSLSERVRRTFAILPINDDDHDITADRRSPERRTIKRTPSGSLRVMPHRGSLSSVRWSGLYTREDDERPSTAPGNFNKRLWGLEKRVDDRGRRLFPGWQDKLEQYRPQNLQRRLSEHRRQKRTEALRQKISGPREVRDGVGEVIKRRSYNGPSYQSSSQTSTPNYARTHMYNPNI